MYRKFFLYAFALAIIILAPLSPQTAEAQSNTPSSIISNESARIIRVVPLMSEQRAEIQKKSEDILSRLSSFSKEIDQIDKDIQTAILPGQVEIVLHTSSPTVSFLKPDGNPTTPLESLEKTLVVRSKSNRPISSKSLTGLAGAFSVKENQYPGTGGTCKDIITKGECTLVVSFDPLKGEGLPLSYDKSTLRYRVESVKLEYEVAKKNLASNAFTLDGKAYIVPEIKFELKGDTTGSTIVGDKREFFVEIHAGDRTRPAFKDVEVNPPTVPFSIKESTCEGELLKECRIHFTFAPVAAGNFPLNLDFSVNNGKEIQKKQIALTATGISNATGLDPAKHILIVYNEDWAESVETKNYYLANRPGFSSANVLGVNFPVAPKCASLSCLSEAIELPPYSKLQTQVLNPIIEWLRENSDKNIQYVVLTRGLPTRPDEATRTQLRIIDGLQNMIRKETAKALSREVFVSSLDMGSLSATKAYIDKLKLMYELMPVKSPVISARGTGREGTTYYFSDAYAPNFEKNSIPAIDYVNAVKAVNPSVNVVHKGFRDSKLTSASDVIGFLHRGIYAYGWNKNYATDGTIKLTGKSSWWIAETAESFNGLWLTNGEQGNFITWFSSNAYGGNNYSNTPAAAVSYVFEPSAKGVNDPSLFTCWDSGKPFAYCAWKSVDDSSYALQAVGDPWVTR